jgi:hypothetical protein
MFSSRIGATRALVPIAEHLFREMQAFGVVSQAFSIFGAGGEAASARQREKLEQYVGGRLAFTKTYMELLETVCDLRFAQTDFPYCYHGQLWPDATPIAGYTGAASDPRPSTVIVSTVALWHLGLVSGSSLSRLLRAALWLAATRDLGRAVDYLIDLHQAGAAGASLSVAQCIQELLAARAQTATDAEMAAGFFGGKLPMTPQEWLQAELAPFRQDSPAPSSEGRTIHAALIQHGLREIEAVRNAPSFDDWLLGQARLMGLLAIISRVLTAGGRELSLGLKAVLAQWEEIMADAFSLTGQVMIYTVPSIDRLTSYILMVQHQYVTQFGESGRERFFRERLLVPALLRSQLLGEDAEAGAADWKPLSWRLVNGLWGVVRSGEVAGLARNRRFDSQELLDVPEVQRFFAQHHLVDRAVQQAAVDIEYHGLFRTEMDDPSSPDGRAFAFLQELDAAAEGDASDTETGGAREELKELLAWADYHLSGEQLLNTVRAAHGLMDQGAYAEALAYLEPVLELYPWNDALYHELSIAYDKQGDHEQALAHIIAAIVLAPDQALRWRSLGVILNALGEREEARIAFAFSRFLEAHDAGGS